MDTPHTYDGYLAARRQEASHSCAAALRSCGVELGVAEVREISAKASGRYSDLSIMDAVSDFFRELKATK